LIRRPQTKGAGIVAAIGGVAKACGGAAARESPKRRSGAPKLAVRGQGGVGEDGEAGGDISDALEGRR
jgi:hypothetical protein